MAKATVKEEITTDTATVAENKGELAVQQAASVPATGKTEIITKPGTAHVTVYKPAEIEIFDDIVEDDDTGLGGGSDAGGQDKRLSILRVLQANSPQAKRNNPAQIPGAKEGDFINTATSEIYDGELGLYFIAAHKHLKYPEYIKREEDGSGGGFLGIYEREDPVVKAAQNARREKFGNLFGPLPHGQTENGKDIELVETYYIDGIYIVPNPDGTFPGEYGTMFSASMAYSSTFIKSYNQWKTRAENMFYRIRRRDGSIGPTQAKLWTHVWHVRTVVRPRGTLTWMVPLITLAEKDEKGVEKEYKYSKLHPDDYLYKAAENLRTDILEGHVELNFDKDQAQADSGDAGQGGTGQGGNIHDNIPFGTAEPE